MAADFLEALIAAWGADATLAGAGVGTLHFGVMPGTTPGTTPYPYVVLGHVAGKAEGRNTGKGYWDTDHWRFNVYGDDLVRTVAVAGAVTAALDALHDQPLSFASGRQMAFRRTGHHLLHLKRGGSEGSPNVWVYSATYLSKIGRTRP